LHRALAGQGPTPREFVLSRFCEEFHCLPSQAYREWRRAPVGLLETILEMREYVRVKRIYDSAPSAAALPDSPLLELVRAFDFELVAEEMAARRG
jgi:hypothetical protein